MKNLSMSLETLLKPWMPAPCDVAPCIITKLTNDSRQVEEGTLFFATPGLHSDGRHFIEDALNKGAAAILYQLEDKDCQNEFRFEFRQCPIIGLRHLFEKQGEIAARFYQNPSQDMTVIGVTGTNGKTSCTHFIAESLKHFKKNCAIMGTLGYGFLPQLQDQGFTTPLGISLQKQFLDLKNQGAEFIAMEVSSHALAQNRVGGTAFDIAVFTQLSRDHLDYHKDMRSYAAAKERLFYQPGLRIAILNLDDSLGLHLARTLDAVQVIGYSLKGHPSLKIPQIYTQEITLLQQGFHVQVQTPWGTGSFETSLFGEFNLYNLLAVIGVLGSLNLPLHVILQNIAALQPVCGRMQQFGGAGLPSVLVDYAHTPDALEKVLQALRPHCKGKLWCVFGCGGDRDRGKRPMMGTIAEQCSDFTVLTNDNPRTEDPEAIIQEIKDGISNSNKLHVQLDRILAIQYAVQSADPNDIILIAGKGHEDYQIIGEKKFPFSDIEHVQAQLTLRKNKGVPL
jgi:UDP-N-acetylmuramoyl-L-alanyl-D-glutamate--2,6-diaminopimelate ligase